MMLGCCEVGVFMAICHEHRSECLLTEIDVRGPSVEPRVSELSAGCLDLGPCFVWRNESDAGVVDLPRRVVAGVSRQAGALLPT